MAGSLNRFAKAKSIYTLIEAMRGWRYAIIPDFIVSTGVFAAADLTGANSGFYVFTAPFDCIFLGYEQIHTTAGTNTLRVKKVVAGTTNAAGAAADANNVDISAALALTGTANTVLRADPVITSGANRIARGDKIAIASAAGTASLAGARGFLRLAAA